MHYFAKLALGGVYKLKGVIYELNKEQAVSKDIYDYLSGLVETRLVDQGDRKAVIRVPIFACRTEDFTVQEKVAEEIKDAPESLRPRRKREEAE